MAARPPNATAASAAIGDELVGGLHGGLYALPTPLAPVDYDEDRAPVDFTVHSSGDERSPLHRRHRHNHSHHLRTIHPAACAGGIGNWELEAFGGLDDDDDDDVGGRGGGGHDDDGTMRTMRCTLCRRARRSFHCADCATLGHFRHTTAERNGETFADKRQRYDALVVQHRELGERAQRALEPARRREALAYDVLAARLRLEHMRAELAVRQKRVAEAKELNQRLNASIEETRKRFPQYANNVDNLRAFVDDRLAKNERLAAERDELQDQLQQRVKRLVHGLVRNVFPITQLHQHQQQHTALSASSQRSPLSSPTAGGVVTMRSDIEHLSSALAEATRTAWVRGRWVLQDSGQHELHYQLIGGPALPANGDYSAYADWVQRQRDGSSNASASSATSTAAAVAAAAAASSISASSVGAGSAAAALQTVPTSANDAYRITAALTYTTQLVNLLGYFLNVNLPYRVNYADFCNKELSAGAFERKCFRLNTNVLALCVAQNVERRLVVGPQTIANLVHLLAAETLGRCGPVEVGVNGGSMADLMQLNAELLAVPGLDSDSDGTSDFQFFDSYRFALIFLLI